MTATVTARKLFASQLLAVLNTRTESESHCARSDQSSFLITNILQLEVNAH